MRGALVAAGVASLLGIGNGLLAAAFRRTGPVGVTRWALAWVLGAGAGSFLLFLLLAAGLELGVATGALVAIGLAALALSLAAPSAPGGREPAGSPDVVAWLLVAASVAAVGVAAFEAIAVPLAAWDSWVNFASKARVLFAEGRLAPSIVADPARLATNPAYPLLLPCLEAFFWELRGAVDERLATLVPLAFHAATLVLLHAAVRRFAPPAVAAGAAAAVAWTPLCAGLAPMGLADPIVGALVVAAFLVTSEERQRPGAAAVAGLLAGLLPWAKDEGLVWLALVAAVAASGSRKRAPEPDRSRLLRAAAFALPALLPAASWQLFLLWHGTERYVFLPPTPANLAAGLERIPGIVLTVATHLSGPGWSFAFPAALVVLAVRRGAALRARDGGLVGVAFGFLAVVSAGFVLSRFDPWLPHVVNSLDRLALQSFPLVAWWLAAQGVDLGVLPGAATERSESRP